MQASELAPLVIEEGKFADVKWWGVDEILSTPIDLFDPGLHRFITKMKQKGIVQK